MSEIDSTAKTPQISIFDKIASWLAVPVWLWAAAAVPGDLVTIMLIIAIVYFYLRLLFGGFDRDSTTQRDIRTHPVLLLNVTCLMPFIAALRVVTFTDPGKVIIPAILIGSCLTVILAIKRRAGQIALVVTWLCLCMGGGLLGLCIDRYFDPAPATLQHSKVVSKSVIDNGAYGRSRTTYYNLDIASWREADGEATYSESVPSTIYYTVQVGGPICLQEHTGRLHIGFHEIQLCPLPE